MYTTETKAIHNNRLWNAVAQKIYDKLFELIEEVKPSRKKLKETKWKRNETTTKT